MNEEKRFLFFRGELSLISLKVGSIVLFILMAAAGGSIEAAVGMLISLTICTLGIGLVIWLCFAWLVGIVIVGPIWGIMKVAGFVTQNRTSTEGETNGETRPQERLSTTELALVDYTIKAKERGFSDTQIASRLQSQGWSNEEIELAQGLANVNLRRRFEGEQQ
ncbi:hypothetical protein [Microseira sp. BLCC-F43]|jgi:hypothetical protein|uniref:hypothetical protein n=1 Tax=Microseira sp. BLCC-F43 TaxID=3153602 RepID=UPI0035BA46EF